MPVKTTRRTALASALALAMLQRRSTSALQVLSKIETDAALSWLPALPADRADWPVSILTYADIAGYWAARGVEQPRSFDDETSERWLEISQRIPLNDGILFLYMNEDWAGLIGFDPWDVDQVAVAFDPPDQVRIYTGTFDPAQITRALAAADYRERSVGEFITLDGPLGIINPSNDLDRMTLGGFNYIAVSESVVISSRMPDLRDGALASLLGDEESLAETPELAEIQTLLPDLHGYVLANLATPDSIGEDVASFPFMLQLAGFNADERGDTVSLVATFADEEAAVAVLPGITDRIENDQVPSAQIRYSELLGEPEIEVIPGSSLVRIVVSEVQFGTQWLQFLYRRDFDYLLTGLG